MKRAVTGPKVRTNAQSVTRRLGGREDQKDVKEKKENRRDNEKADGPGSPTEPSTHFVVWRREGSYW